MTRLVLLASAVVLGLALCASAALPGEPTRKPRRDANKKPSKRPDRKPGKRPPKPPAAGPVRKPAAKPGAEPGAESHEKGAEAGTVYVLQDTDAVILRDGTRISGTILCAGQAAVTLLTPDGEKTIPRAKIERVIKNTDAGFPKKFKAEETDGHKYLVEAPPEDEVPADEGDDGPGGKPKRKPRAKPKATPKTKAPATRTPKARPQTPKLPNLPGDLPNIQLPKDPAKLRALLQKLKKEGKLQALMKDPRASEMLRKALRQN